MLSVDSRVLMNHVGHLSACHLLVTLSSSRSPTKETETTLRWETACALLLWAHSHDADAVDDASCLVMQAQSSPRL